MKNLLLIFIISILFSCSNSKRDIPITPKSKTDTSVKEEITKDSPLLISNIESSETSLEKTLPPIFLDSINIVHLKTDSTNEYGAGDCWGTIRSYSNDTITLGIDSMSCGEYGYSYSHFYFKNDTNLYKVRRIDSETIIQPEGNQYKLTEIIIDFEKGDSLTRTDTTDDYTISILSNDFHTHILDSIPNTKKYLTSEYQGFWEMGIDY